MKCRNISHPSHILRKCLYTKGIQDGRDVFYPSHIPPFIPPMISKKGSDGRDMGGLKGGIKGEIDFRKPL